jgi:hypothetical protein
MGRKARGGWFRNPDEPLVEHQLRLERAAQLGRVGEMFDAMTVTDAELEHGLADGTLAMDTRLRNALRALRTDDGGFRLPGAGPRLAFPMPGIDEAADFAAEASVLASIDGIPRAESRVSALEARLAALRTLPRR